jgi:hypothetical protein
MKVLASRGCDVGSKNKDKSSEEADLPSVEAYKARVSSCRIVASDEALVGEKGRERREERGEGSTELPSSHGRLTRRLVR